MMADGLWQIRAIRGGLAKVRWRGVLAIGPGWNDKSKRYEPNQAEKNDQNN
jgi:hypothetical protein